MYKPNTRTIIMVHYEINFQAMTEEITNRSEKKHTIS